MNFETSYPELVSTVTPLLLQGDLNPFSASRVAGSAFNFEPELRQLDERFSLLTLYNGPTGVFKDFGIAFLAAMLEELLKTSGHSLVLAAARGDTGASIAAAFRNRPGITAVILYPSGPVRGLDPATFVPNGGNIIPIQIRGTFDDCQRLSVEMINDRPFAERYGITGANAINVGRLIPQAFYYLYAFTKIKRALAGDLYFSVPSGNFGNLIAGLYAWKFGMPVNGFIAAMNVNNAFGDFIRGKAFAPHPLVSTKSPALDVTAPSNYERLASFYEDAPAVMRNMVYPASVSDAATLATMEKVYRKFGIFLNPHSAVAFAAAEELAPRLDQLGHFVILATGHPARQAAIVKEATGQTIKIPYNLELLHRQSDPIALIDPQLDALEGVVASCL